MPFWLRRLCVSCAVLRGVACGGVATLVEIQVPDSSSTAAGAVGRRAGEGVGHAHTRRGPRAEK